MASLSRDQTAKGERTLLTSVLLSAPGVIVTGFAAASSSSATQIADFIRRSAELVALSVSWWIFRKLRRGVGADDGDRLRLERAANRSVAGALACSAIAMLVIGIHRLFTYEPTGDLSMGLIIALLGVIVNTGFWWRFRSMTRERFDPIIAGQQRLYAAKAFVDLCVAAALAAVAIAPKHPATQYVDACGSIIVAGYLLYQGIDLGRKSRTGALA